jgi:predicted secreted hydrolase
MQFPKDNFPHKSRIEWWYFNGNLEDKKGNRYAFMNCLFKTDPRKTDIPLVNKIPAKEVYFSHSTLSDLKNNKFIARTHPLSVLSKDSLTKKNLFINYLNPSTSGYMNNELIQTGKSEYKIKNEDIELTLKARKKPFMHNGNGEFNLEKIKVYYYSLTDLEAEGIIRINGKPIEVKGRAWMDHEWTAGAGAKNWDWFSVQLDNGTELMINYYNNGEHAYAGINPKNQKGEFAEDLILLPKKIWKSRVTCAEYPTAWRIEVPSKKIALDVKAVMEKQEILFGSLNYWEGPTGVSGTMGGKKVHGRGFMELVGREMKKTSVQLYKHQLKKEAAYYINLAKKELKHLWKNRNL